MKILYVANVDWFFLSHRLPLAKEAISRGWEVYLIAGNTGVGYEVEKYGIKYIPWDLSRAGKNPFLELKSIFFLYQKYKEINPDIIHQIALKPVLYGTFIAKLLGIKKIINALSGLGYSFTSNRKTGGVLSFFLRFILRTSNNTLILQNNDDIELFISKKVIQKNKIVLIKGSGVDTELFCWKDEPKNNPLIVMLPSRMLADKGVREFIEVAKRLKEKARFVLVGGVDKENLAWISEEEIKGWVSTDIVEWWGHKTVMQDVLSQANIVVLPSYREGLPKVLIEASAIGRAIVTTNVPGCREIIKHNENGLLVTSQDSNELTAAILLLIENSNLRLKLASKAYEIVQKEYSIGSVVTQTFRLYE